MGRHKSPLTKLREKIRRLGTKAYYAGKIRDADAQAEYIWKDETGFNNGDATATIKLAVFYMIKAVVNSKWRADLADEERDLFGPAMKALQSEFPFVDDAGETVMRAKRLGDWGITEVEITRERKKANIKAATNERHRFERAAMFVIPLIEKNPEWTWSDAVAYGKKTGTLPNLDT